MQRIWNESELKSMPEFYLDEKYPEMWCYKYCNLYAIPFEWIGKKIEEIKSRCEGNIIEYWMIAKEPKEGSSIERVDSPARELTLKGINLNQNNMETKKVTLSNGTVLEVGKKYRLSGWKDGYFEYVSECESRIFGKMTYDNGVYEARMLDKDLDWLPYTPPTPQKEWKTFLIEIELSDGTPCQKIERYLSESDASKHWEDIKGVKSITEVKINIEPVNS